MAVNFDSRCSSCGETHFCHLSSADFVTPGAAYYLSCPKTANPATVIAPDGWHKVEYTRPSGAVDVRERP